MRQFIILLYSLLIVAALQAQPLRFNGDGTFKIVQITDLHFKNGNALSDTSISMLKRLIRDEKPDIAIFTGDIVVDPAPVQQGWKSTLAPFQKAGIPFAVALGNHDDEHDKTRKQIISFLEKEKGSLSRTGDYTLPVRGKSGKPEALLYIFDSNSYSTLPEVKGYGWITHQQVEEFRAKSSRLKRLNKGINIPSLAFFHIPLPEFRTAFFDSTNPPIGTRDEEESAPEINSGLLAAMLEQGGFMGCFVGHDHMNDYIAYKYDMALAYGRSASSGTAYGDLKSGCRVIILKEGSKSFTTYIYNRDGSRSNMAEYPRKLRLAITADTHFDPGIETDQYKNVMAINQLQPDGTVILGDVFDRQSDSVIPLFKKRYLIGKGDSTIHSPLYIGMGNHDINPVSKNKNLNLKERGITLSFVDSLLRKMKDEGKITNLHEGTRNYSFDLNGVHFIQTHTWAGDTTLGKGGLEWLSNDLKKFANNNQPVIVLMHYTFDSESLPWISQPDRDTLASTLKGYNVLAIFNGHNHTPSRSEWEGIKVYTADNAWKDESSSDPSFYLLEYSSSEGLSVKQYSWDNNTLKLTINPL